jgi:molybdopterin-guanine dinucleotide biosynthesis protein A
MTLSGAAMNASAIIFAGGKSSRLGGAQCMLPFDGEPLNAQLVRRLQPLFAVFRRADPQGLSFININLPEDYQSALRRWRSG